MKLKTLLIVLLPFIVLSCVSKEENEKLKLEKEELEAELSRAQMGVATLEEIGVLMDSIDAARKSVTLNLESGTSYEDYLDQMKEINDYVKTTENKIAALEGQFSEATANNRAYLSTIKRLKSDLATKTKEIEELSAAVEDYRTENTKLLSMVEIQESELNTKTLEIERKREELAFLETRMMELMTQAQVSEADAYFARAAAIEEAANRTKLAPKKKKETLKEALDLYKRSYALGKEEAQEKIEELEKSI